MQDTPSRLREAAERLLADRPPGRISLRDITESAGANVASVGYHFGSKDALLETVVREALLGVSDRQRALLAALPDDAPLEDVVRTWIGPALDSLVRGRDERDRRQWRVLQNALAEPTPATASLLENLAASVETHLLRRLAVHLPELTAGELRLRHAATLAALGGLGSGSFAVLLGGPDPQAVGDQLVAWVVGGLSAPSAAVSPGRAGPDGGRPRAR